jgi:hypothetical protein
MNWLDNLRSKLRKKGQADAQSVASGRRSDASGKIGLDARSYLLPTSTPNAFLVFPVESQQRLSSSKKVSEDLARFMREKKASLGAVVRIQSGSLQSTHLVVSRIKPEKKTVYLSGIHALTLADPNSQSSNQAYLFQLEEHVFCAWVSMEGRQLPTSDQYIGSYEDALQALKRWRDEIRITSIQTSSTMDDAYVADLKRIATVKTIDLDAFDPNLRELAGTRLTPVQRSIIRPIIIGAAILGLAFIAFKIVSAEIKKRELNKTAIEIQKQRVAAYEAAVNQAIKTDWGGTAALQYESFIKPFLESYPGEIKGWELTNINCNIPTGNCDLKVRRTTGTYLDLQNALPKLDIPLSEIFSVVNFSDPKDSQAVREASPFPKQSLPSVAVNFREAGDLFALLNEAEIPAQPLTPAKPIAAFAGTGAPPPAPLRGNWKIGSTPIHKLNGLTSLPANFTLTEFTIDFTNAKPLNFTAQGIYYVQ